MRRIGRLLGSAGGNTGARRPCRSLTAWRTCKVANLVHAPLATPAAAATLRRAPYAGGRWLHTHEVPRRLAAAVRRRIWRRARGPSTDRLARVRSRPPAPTSPRVQPVLAHPRPSSPSALSRFLGCEYRTYLDVLEARDEPVGKRNPPNMELLLERGNRYEEQIIARWRAEGRSVLTIERARPGTRQRRVDETLAAMRAGQEVIHQGCFVHEGWVGYPDFLIRVDGGAVRSRRLELRGGRRQARQQAAARVHLPAALLRRPPHPPQGRRPARMRLLLGDDTDPEFTADDFNAYAARIHQLFAERRAQLEAPTPEPAPATRTPSPAATSATGGSTAAIDAATTTTSASSPTSAATRASNSKRTASTRSPSSPRCPGTRSSRAWPPAPSPRSAPSRPAAALPRPRAPSLRVLEARARTRPRAPPEALRGRRALRLRGRPVLGRATHRTGRHPLRVRRRILGRRRPRLPLRHSLRRAGGHTTYWPLWATTRAEERAAFERWIDWIHARLEQHKDLHVYHYNSYEVVALKRLATRHATRIDELDDLLRKEVFVDLYGITRQAIRAGVESYGLKGMEPVYAFERNAELKGAIGS